MFESISAFFVTLMEGRFGFYEVWEFFVNLYYSVTKAPDIMNIWSALMSVLNPIISYVPYILIALCLIIAFFGKKLLSVLKFVASFGAGFVCGVHFIGPLLMPLVNVPTWVCGLVLAVIAAVLYRFIYDVAFAVSVVYCVYVLCYTGLSMRDGAEHTDTKAVICIAVAIGVTILAFILKKYVEMAGTAILGGYLISYIIRCMIYDYKALDWLQDAPWAGAAAITAIIALPAFMVQYRTRQRY